LTSVMSQDVAWARLVLAQQMNSRSVCGDDRRDVIKGVPGGARGG
jgi:hypothetical protein